MSWLRLIALLAAIGRGSSINRPVYKIMLTQKGFAQFLQYDIDIPPMREFTLCTWIKFHSLQNDQSIFTYVAHGNNRVIRLWLDPVSETMNLRVDDRASFNVPVEIAKDAWRHVCLSYQSDYGAWALYIDSKLITCEATQSLYGYIIPGGGSILVGYGTSIDTADVTQNGVQGEIFGVNMILVSTIERNYTVKNHPSYEQKPFKRDKVKHDDIEYVVFSNLKTDDLNRNLNEQAKAATNSSNNFIFFKTPDSFIDHTVEKTSRGRIPKQTSSNEEEILDVLNSVVEHPPPKDDKNEFGFWNLVTNSNDNSRRGKFIVPTHAPISFTKHAYPMLSEYEVPPPLAPKMEYSMERNSVETEKSIFNDLNYNFAEDVVNHTQNSYNKRQMNDISDIETPPLPVYDPKVYGQWTSSKLAGSVLNYLKSINFHNQDKKVPPTIHLNKISDVFPYATDLKINLIKPSASFKRKNLIIENRKYNPNMFNSAHSSHLKKLRRKHKRHAIMPQINVQIVDSNSRDEILKTHAQTKPVNVEVTPRSKSKIVMEHRFYRNINEKPSSEEVDVTSNTNKNKAKPFMLSNNNWNLNSDKHKSNSLLTVLPFLKSIEYFTEESDNSLSNIAKKNNDMYSKSLSNRNKWHNIKSYNNDYTPRRINMNTQDGKPALDNSISDVNIKHPAIRIKYKSDINKVVENKDDEHIIKGRLLAGDVSNQSDYNKDSVSILKYNHGYLPGHDQKVKNIKGTNLQIKLNTKPTGLTTKNFDKRVKIGNALNEQRIIGKNIEEKKKSFVGGNEKIPDIQRYKSVFDNETNNVPNSLRPRVCRNVELYNRLLYVQPDESIDMTHILSPIRKKNIGIQFIIQNYNKCSLDESPLRKNPLLLINWNETPVRLFGGAKSKKTTDLCGFF